MGSPGSVIRFFGIFAMVHSLLASRQAKALARRLAGARYHDGLYRFCFCVQSGLLLAWGGLRFLLLPDRLLYQVPAPWSWLLRLGQLCSLLFALAAAWVIGPLRFGGLPQALSLLTGKRSEPEPEAQGPPQGQDGAMLMRGPFRFSRHPANMGAIGVCMLLPKMTVNRAVLAALSTLYLLLGSLHEERRLLRRYGAAYERYRQRVPFVLGRPGPAPPAEAGAETLSSAGKAAGYFPGDG